MIKGISFFFALAERKKERDTILKNAPCCKAVLKPVQLRKVSH